MKFKDSDMVKVETDFVAYSKTKGGVKREIKIMAQENSCKIKLVELHGPGGGNPLIKISGMFCDVQRFMVRHCGGDEEQAFYEMGFAKLVKNGKNSKKKELRTFEVSVGINDSCKYGKIHSITVRVSAKSRNKARRAATFALVWDLSKDCEDMSIVEN